MSRSSAKSCQIISYWLTRWAILQSNRAYRDANGS